MSAQSIRPAARVLLSVGVWLAASITGCTSTAAEPDASRDGAILDVQGLDTPGLDAPGLDAPGLDAANTDASREDAPATTDAPLSCATGCDDGDACNGLERCVEGACVEGTPVTCTPSNACHAASCDAATGACAETLIDGDGDGEAARTLGACGTDCDDTRAHIARGAVEVVGNEVDEDCDGGEVCFFDADRDGYRTDATRPSTDIACSIAEGESVAVQPLDCDDANGSIHAGVTERAGDGVDQNCDGRELCYHDADIDGFRSPSAFESADPDCTDPGEAGGGALLDCCDGDARAFPGQGVLFGASEGGVICGGWDFDCNGIEERAITATAVCTVGSGSVPMCMFGRAGWNFSAPACGATGSWVTHCSGAGSCSRTTETRDQFCR